MKKGFSLPEFLIAMAIVGVVAVLTLPSTVKRYQDKMFVAQLQRTYNEINNVMPAFLLDSETGKLYDTSAFNIWIRQNGMKDMEYFLKTYFKAFKVCSPTTSGGLKACKGRQYKRMNGIILNNFGGDACAILKIGSTICFERMKNPHKFPHLYIDVNGPKGPNIWGRDAYMLEIDNRGNVAETFSGYNHPKNKAEDCEHNIYGAGCFNRILGNSWIMDY